jgi:predicted nucleic acid-binding protein
MNVLVDTNVVLRVSGPEIRGRGDHDHALQRLLDRGDTLYMCAQVAIEYWSVATRPVDVNGLGLPPANAEMRLRYFETLLVWLPEPDDIGPRWRRIVNQYAVQGKKAHDARLVAFMQAHGLTHLLTLNTADFARYREIATLHPKVVQ